MKLRIVRNEYLKEDSKSYQPFQTTETLEVYDRWTGWQELPKIYKTHWIKK